MKLTDNTRISSELELPYAFSNRDLLICQFVYLCAIKEYILKGGKSRGSYLIEDRNGELPLNGLPEAFRFSLDDGSLSGLVCEIGLEVNNGSLNCTASWNHVRPIPEGEHWFENVWNDHRKGRVFS